MLMAAQMGVARQVENVKRGRTPAYGSGNQNDWQLHIEGALGEFAAAKALGLFPAGMSTLRACDLPGVEVRTRSQPWHSLILHPDDDDEAAFLLVSGVNGTYDMTGWITGGLGKEERFWSDPSGEGRPAYFVPQEHLAPFDQLVALLRRARLP